MRRPIRWVEPKQPGLKGQGEAVVYLGPMQSEESRDPVEEATGRSDSCEGCSANLGREQERNPGPLLLQLFYLPRVPFIGQAN